MGLGWPRQTPGSVLAHSAHLSMCQKFVRPSVQKSWKTLPPTAGGLEPWRLAETHLHCPGPLTSPTHSSGLGIRLIVVYKGSQ